MDWTEQYRPETLDAVRGNDYAISQLRDWAASWGDEHTNAIILYGPPGIGKTTAAHAVANDAGWDSIEMNASEHRTEDIVNKVAGSAAHMGTLTGGTSGRRLVIIDEADNFHGTVDRGGSKAIRDVVDDPSQPVILIANEFYDMSNGLRDACDSVEFEYPDTPEIARFLRDICDDEGYDYDVDALKTIAGNADGDVRAAVNDLQTAATHATDDTITTDDIPSSARDRTETIFPFIDTVLQDGSPEDAVTAAYSVDETPDDIMQWIEENVVTEYSPAELSDAYQHLAAADQWLGRVRATQDYSYWRYVTEHATAGVAASRHERHDTFTPWDAPSTWSKLSQTRGHRNQRDAIAQRIASEANVSMGTARNTILPYLRILTHHCKNRDTTIAMAAAYDLDEDDVAFITGSGADTNKVANIVAAATDTDDTDTDDEAETDTGGSNATLADIAETDTDETAPSDDTTTDETEESDDDAYEQATLF